MRTIQQIREDAFVYLGNYGGDREFVLNAHLVIEEVIDIILQKQFEVPIAYKKASFRFNQKILLLEAINGRKIDTWVYSSLKVFNSLRNSYAHVLEPLNSQQKIKDFLNIAYEKDQEFESKANRHLDTLAKNKADKIKGSASNAATSGI